MVRKGMLNPGALLSTLKICSQLVCSCFRKQVILAPTQAEAAHLWIALSLDLGRAQQELLASAHWVSSLLAHHVFGCSV